MHKLIVAVERVEQAKAPKDILQAHTLIQALALRRPAELAQAWKTAWASGDQWRKKLDAGGFLENVSAQIDVKHGTDIAEQLFEMCRISSRGGRAAPGSA